MPLQTRRRFFKTLAAGGAALGVRPLVGAAPEPPLPRPQVQRRMLGRTGVEVPILTLGLGSVYTRAFGNRREEGEALLQTAIDHGATCWDTARGYGASESMIGPVLEKHRDRVFMISKSGRRDHDGYMRDLETSLRNLRTDYLDVYHFHELRRAEEVDAIEQGALVAARKMKDQKVIRHLGVTGHSGAAVLMDAVRRFDPDTLLTVYPVSRPDRGRYEDDLLPLARERRMGVFAMKIFRQARNADLRGVDLIRYALTLDGVHSAVAGQDSAALLAESLAMAADFQPLPAKEMARLTDEAHRMLSGETAPWDRPGYEDQVVA